MRRVEYGAGREVFDARDEVNAHPHFRRVLVLFGFEHNAFRCLSLDDAVREVRRQYELILRKIVGLETVHVEYGATRRYASDVVYFIRSFSECYLMQRLAKSYLKTARDVSALHRVLLTKNYIYGNRNAW